MRYCRKCEFFLKMVVLLGNGPQLLLVLHADYNGDGDRLLACLSMIRNANSGCWLDLVIDFDPGDSLRDIFWKCEFRLKMVVLLGNGPQLLLVLHADYNGDGDRLVTSYP